MKKIVQLSVFLIVVSISFSFAQSPSQFKGEMISEIAPSDFKNYNDKILVVPAFRASGTTKWLTKQFDKNYGKPFHVVEVKEISDGLELEEYPIDEYKYMVFIQSSKNFSGNTAYSFQLVDRSTQTVYYHHKSGNSLKKYIKKILE
ncbi:hypothetical protein WNY78_09040 [Psychroserpens sp. AS72]|uniref:hypothetical protein n=1 Tax=Psychroserpens sp. AS72 TaxID=3135775 RepID=UPI00317D5A21